MLNSDIKVAILAGGQGKRMASNGESPPKALARIGDQPIIEHIIERYAAYGFRQFLIAGGYKVKELESYFAHRSSAGWEAMIVDTGERTATGGRIKRLAPYIGEQRFMLTWCDGLADIDHLAALAFHETHGKLATVTAVHPPARFGRLELSGAQVIDFKEKPPQEGEWINGAFFILEPGIFEFIEGDHTEWELEPMEQLARQGQLMAYRHEGFWRCMDSVKDHEELSEFWASGNAPWLGRG